MSRTRRLLAHIPLSLRLLLCATGLVTVALLATGFLGSHLLYGYLLERLDRQLTGTATRISHEIDSPRSDRLASPLPAAYTAWIVDEAGTLIRRIPPHEDSPPNSLLTTLAAPSSIRAHQPFTTSGADGDWRGVALPLSGGRTLVTMTSLAESEATVARLVAIDLLVGAGAVIALACVGHLLVHASLRPLRTIEVTAESIVAGDLSCRVPVHPAWTEAGRLGRALNAMLNQIESAVNAQRASESAARDSEERMRTFIADASHELRTPLTSLRGYAELAHQTPHEPAQLMHLMQRIQDGGTRMAALVEDLLLLARLDQHRPRAHLPADVFDLAVAAVLDARARDPHRPIELVRLDNPQDTTTPVPVLGDVDQLRQILDNLLTNALTHTPESASIEVRIGLRETTAVIEVADEGPGMTAQQAERVFERFYRTAAARTHPGTGLGLSIVAALAAAHKGTTQLETAPEAGCTFRVILPSAASNRGG
ncbi:HAMP domain-containing sensor histidine kinase [Streptomyces sp. SCSIO 30461]|uniref:sensor histidine kinase n=1 Tax=Streptomyces sp. SCSIO 30461 TaxID=3118085 RepID=UPI0030D61248